MKEYLKTFDDFEHETTEIPDEFSVKFSEKVNLDIECFTDEEAIQYLQETQP